MPLRGQRAPDPAQGGAAGPARENRAQRPEQGASKLPKIVGVRRHNINKPAPAHIEEVCVQTIGPFDRASGKVSKLAEATRAAQPILCPSLALGGATILSMLFAPTPPLALAVALARPRLPPARPSLTPFPSPLSFQQERPRLQR